MSDPREALAARLGILPRYFDQSGQNRPTSPETRDALLVALGHDPGMAADALDALDAEAVARHLPPWQVVQMQSPLALPLADDVAWTLTLEDGGTRAGQGGALAPLPLGLHRLDVAGQLTWLLSAPPRLPEPPRSWGVTLPLYGLRTEAEGGLGSYADLARAVTALGRVGAAFVGVNPIHAGFSEDPGAYSPYSPSHRRRLNTAHIDAGAVPAPGGLIDYAAVAPAQTAALEARFAETPPGAEFGAWRAAQGAPLERFATHQALSEVLGPYWSDWPSAFQAPDTAEVAAFAAAHPARLTFHAWAQWMAETQLDEASAAGAALPFGLYLDLAVGTHPAGAETWAHPGHFARGVSLGAPPDAFAADGQRWNLAPFDPQALVAEGFMPLAETLRAQLRFARLLRIDHILGFERAFWVPGDGVPGAYVDMPTEAMLAVARIEAARAGATIIGEDLGNIPAGLRDQLAASGILGCRVAIFEQVWGGAPQFKAPDAYDVSALCSFGTHDLPVFEGWKVASDIDWRQRLGSIDAGRADEARRRRAAEVAALGRAAGGLDLEHLDGFLAATPSRLVALQIEDILGLKEQPNLPGTTQEFPNWRRRLPVPAGAFGEVPALQRAAEQMAEAKRGEETWTS